MPETEIHPVLGDLERAMKRAGIPFLPLGRWPSGLALGMLEVKRATGPPDGGDLDIAFPADSPARFRQAAAALEEEGFRPGGAEEERLHPGGTRVTLWPFGEGIAPGQRLAWRESGRVYSTTGLDSALARACPVKVARDLTVLVPPVPQIFLVRIVFYFSRMAARDLGEIVFLLENYPGDPRPAAGRNRPSSPPAGARMGGANRLGRDVRASLSAPHLRIVHRFLEEIQVVHSPLIARILREEGSLSEGRRIQELFGKFDAFRRGLASREEDRP